MRSLRRAHEWLGRYPVTRFGMYCGAGCAVTLSLMLAVLVVRRGLHGVSLWSPRLTGFALQGLVPIMVITLMGLPIDWAARRKAWWAHAMAGAVVGPAWALAVGLTPAPLQHAAIGVAVFVLLGGFRVRPKARHASPARLVPDKPAPVTEGEFTEWTRSWQAARRKTARPITLMLRAIAVGAAALNAWLLPHYMSRGWSAASMLVIVIAGGIVSARIGARRYRLLVREVGRFCSGCRSTINDPQAVIRSGGRCMSCGTAVYTPAA
ncbi:MAG: hypothetical protein ABR499_22330 [Gemmatimonadaceae bacterium]